MTKNRIYISSPHMSGNEQKYIKEAFDTNWIAPLGQNVDEFEKAVMEYTKTNGAVATSSGTAAIHLALELIGVGKGDVVFCSSLTFVASANPILYQEAEPVFIDSEPETWNMSPIALKRAFDVYEKIGKLPKAVIVVNLYGQSADLFSIKQICDDYNVPIIEDAAESLGATFQDKMSGTIGKFGVFSFNGNKIITTSGGGMLISNDLEALERARHLATQARDQAIHYQHSVKGYNYRLSNILAGVGRAQMEVLPDRINARRAVYNRYKTALSDIQGISFMPEADFGLHTRWLTTLTIDEKKTGFSRTEVIETLLKENIESRPVWKPLHLQPLFKETNYYQHRVNVSVSEYLFEKGLCLPSGSNLTVEEQERIINLISSLVKVSLY
jgi:pyridoxal phosphate-dependent aminotransferase EpsN